MLYRKFYYRGYNFVDLDLIHCFVEGKREIHRNTTPISNTTMFKE
ncbi:hypothetical protein VCR12J2_620116 [Vibrio coralliirubri]|nr:hypothetical protein VCR12J2_620116 [Vibrio coralliirubri]